MSTPSPTTDFLDLYRRTFYTAEDGDCAWWYLGTTMAEVPGQHVLPVMQAETVMVYRSETLSDDSFRVHWWEIGYFRDPVTGEIASSWRNPLTGIEATPPRGFEEGPCHYDVHRAEQGVRLELVQPHAVVLGVAAVLSHSHGQCHIAQTERKARGYPSADGSLPDPTSTGAAQATTILSVHASQADLASGAAWVPGSGEYSFELTMLPPWMGFGALQGKATTYGRMHKARVNEPLNPLAWQRLKAVYPQHFNGDRITPVWS